MSDKSQDKENFVRSELDKRYLPKVEDYSNRISNKGLKVVFDIKKETEVFKGVSSFFKIERQQIEKNKKYDYN